MCLTNGGKSEKTSSTSHLTKGGDGGKDHLQKKGGGGKLGKDYLQRGLGKE